MAVLGAFAQKPRYQGAGSSYIGPARLDSPLEELQNWLGDTAKVSYSPGYSQVQNEEQPDQQLIEEAVALAGPAPVAIIFAGLPGPFESEGYARQHIYMPESYNRLIEEVCRVQPNTVVVLQNGSAVAMPWLSGPNRVCGVSGRSPGRNCGKGKPGRKKIISGRENTQWNKREQTVMLKLRLLFLILR